MYHYWEHGIHYYKSSHQGDHKNFIYDNNIYVIGEMVSHQQGWVEGAIHSVTDSMEHLSDGKN